VKSFLRRFGYALLTIYLSLTAIFFAIHLSPGDPIERILGPEAQHEATELLRQQLGLHLPLIEQYGEYLKALLRGDLGKSLFSQKEVRDLVVIHAWPSMVLATISISLSTFFGLLIGAFVAVKKSTFSDRALRVVALIFLSFPIFSLAPLLVLFFSIYLGLLPVSEWGSLSHAVLPCLTLVLPLTSVVLRVTRNKYLEENSGQWVTVLAAKGLSRSAIILRVIKVCLPTIFNVVAIQISVVLAGTMITETIFDIPGMGSLLFDAIQNRDYPVVQGVIIYSTLIYMAVYFAVDWINEKIDPRIEA
jgi:peptide/nickel transport system permease protein